PANSFAMTMAAFGHQLGLPDTWDSEMGEDTRTASPNLHSTFSNTLVLPVAGQRGPRDYIAHDRAYDTDTPVEDNVSVEHGQSIPDSGAETGEDDWGCGAGRGAGLR